MSQHLKVVIFGLIVAGALHAQALGRPLESQAALGPGCDEEPSIGSHGSTVPLVRVRRQLQQPAQNPLSFFQELGPQVEKVQSSAKMFTSLFSSANPNQAAAASQLQQAFQPQQAPQQAPAATLMSQLTEMVRSAQDSSSKLAASSQQQAQQATSGVQSALAEIGQGLQKIAMNNPSLLPDIKNLYSSVSSKLSPAAQPASFPSGGPIVPAKNGDQLIDNLAKVATGQTQ